MKPESCREWRESLGAYALGQLGEEERVRLEAHLEGCPSCSAEIEQLAALSHPMSLADPARFDTAPALPPALAGRVAAAIGGERQTQRRRRVGFGLGVRGRRCRGRGAAGDLRLHAAARRRAPSSTSASPRCRRASRSRRS